MRLCIIKTIIIIHHNPVDCFDTDCDGDDDKNEGND